MNIKIKGYPFVITHVILFTLFLALIFFLYTKSSEYIDVISGLIICKSDCTDFHNYSNYIVKNSAFYPADPDFHSSIFYRGYILLIAIIKMVFGSIWKFAYTIFSVATIYMFLMISAGSIGTVKTYWYTFLTGYLFTLTNLNLLIYSRTLLSDFLFAVGAGFFFTTLAFALHQQSKSKVAIAFFIAVFMCLIRPSGVFLIIIALAPIIIWLFPPFKRMKLDLISPVIAGLATMTFVAILSSQLVATYENRDNWPKALQAVGNEILEVNYFGKDDLPPEKRLGAIVVNFPYKEWSYNDGSATEIALAFAQRIVKVFEIGIKQFSTRNNTIRYGYYGLLYTTLILLIFVAFTKKDESLYLISIWVSYLLIYATISHVSTRYRLTFDLMWIVAAMYNASWVATKVQQRGSNADIS